MEAYAQGKEITQRQEFQAVRLVGDLLRNYLLSFLLSNSYSSIHPSSYPSTVHWGATTVHVTIRAFNGSPLSAWSNPYFSMEHPRLPIFSPVLLFSLICHYFPCSSFSSDLCSPSKSITFLPQSLSPWLSFRLEGFLLKILSLYHVVLRSPNFRVRQTQNPIKGSHLPASINNLILQSLYFLSVKWGQEPYGIVGWINKICNLCNVWVQHWEHKCSINGSSCNYHDH